MSETVVKVGILKDGPITGFGEDAVEFRGDLAWEQAQSHGKQLSLAHQCHAICVQQGADEFTLFGYVSYWKGQRTKMAIEYEDRWMYFH